eukprot:Skav202750  [mRNA]  locus=scaffold3516:24380:31633:+ [translate_table: standard]
MWSLRLVRGVFQEWALQQMLWKMGRRNSPADPGGGCGAPPVPEGLPWCERAHTEAGDWKLRRSDGAHQRLQMRSCGEELGLRSQNCTLAPATLLAAIMAARADCWTTVGYHAFEQKQFDQMCQRDQTGLYYTEISPMRWSSTPLLAISYTRKEAARKLGATLSECQEPGKAKTPKKSGSQKQDALEAALECPNYVIWRLQTQENIAEQVVRGFLKPYHDVSKGFDMAYPFTPFELPRKNGEWRVDLVPATMQAIFVDQPPKRFFGQQDQTNLQCSYYLALPTSPTTTNLSELIQVKHAAPLLKLLLQNERDEEVKILLENCCALRGDYIGVPLVASPITAMTLGFFAYKPESLSGHQSQPLQLLQFNSPHLLDRMPPISNPLCPFWLMKPDGLVRMINDCLLALTVEHFKMQVTVMAEYKPQVEFLERQEKLRLQFRKRGLEERVEQLQADLDEQKAELAQAPWDPEACATSIKVNGLYEASGLALWVRSGVYSNGAGKDSDPGDVSFGALQKFLDSFFSKEVAMKGHICRGTKKQKQVKMRLLWPITMVCGCEAPVDVEGKSNFDSSLNTAGSHFVLWAWYLALSRALQKNAAWIVFACDKEWLDLLWEAGCCVTIQMRLCPSDVDWALAKNHASEQLKAIKDSSLSSTFLDFALIVRQLGIQQVSDGVDYKLRFNSAQYNSSMHRAALGVLSLMDNGKDFQEAMRLLDLPPHSPGEIAAWLIDMLDLALKLNLTTPSKATEVWLLGDRVHKTAGYWQACLVVSGFLIPLKDKLPEAESKKLDAAIGSLIDPRQCWTKFLETERARDGLIIKEEDEAEPEPASAETTALDSLKGDFNKATGSMLDLFFDMMQGKYLNDCRKLGAENVKLAQLVSEAANHSQGDSKSETAPCELVKAICLVVQGFDTNAKSVSITAAAPAPSLIATLNSNADGGDENADRERIWKLVQGERRKYITFSVVPRYSKDALNNVFRQCGKVWSFTGQLNSSHRLIIASADLLSETSSEPWLNYSSPAPEVWKTEDAVLSQPQTEEIFLIYSGGCPPRAGRARKVPLAARKVESAALRFPAQRSKFKTIKKENFTSCGEATTFQNTYSGVSFRPASELPLITSSEKVKILPVSAAQAAPAAWQESHNDDVPLFWQEGKPINFYLAILDEFKIKACFDATAGSGALMEACLTRGVQYHGCCLNKEHMGWLQGVADRASCGLVSIEGSTLHSSELASDVKKHFPDVLRTLVAQEEEEEDEAVEPDSDVD